MLRSTQPNSIEPASNLISKQQIKRPLLHDGLSLIGSDHLVLVLRLLLLCNIGARILLSQASAYGYVTVMLGCNVGPTSKNVRGRIHTVQVIALLRFIRPGILSQTRRAYFQKAPEITSRHGRLNDVQIRPSTTYIVVVFMLSTL